MSCAHLMRLHKDFEAICAEAEATTGHGKLLRIECHPIGREVIVNFCYFTADAQGMNMIVKATEQAKAEFRHPIAVNLFATFWISLRLLPIVIVPALKAETDGPFSPVLHW